MRLLVSVTAIRGLLAVSLAVLGIAVVPAGAVAATDGPYQDVYYVNSCATSASANSAPIFSSSSYGDMSTADGCPSNYGLDIDAGQYTNDGDSGKWSTITPTPAIGIVGVTSAGLADCNLHSDGFNADYFYGDGNVNYGVPSITVDCHGALGRDAPAGYLNEHIQSSRYFGWQTSCTKTTCTPTGAGVIVFAVQGITLEAQETSGPSLSLLDANSLAKQAGWVRGTFAASVSASDPSGVCGIQATVNGKAINSYSDPSPDTSQWSQCPGNDLDSTVDTASYPNGAGAIALVLSASNAAGAVSSISRSVNVDNAPVSVSLSGPADAATTSGTQYVTATASAGPSGVSAVYCSVDGGAVRSYPGASAQVPVSGIGSHQVACYARNRALDSSGVAASSQTQTLGLSIRQLTAAAITFARIVGALRCHRAIEKVKVVGRRRTVRRHGRKVVVRGRARTIKKVVRRCHAPTVRRRVTIIVKRHGRRVKIHKVERVVVLPHTVEKSTRRVGYGKATTVSGYVGLVDGTALSGRNVEVLAAPNNGLGQFAPIATVTTNAYGEWSARVPAGPSRLIEAQYGGDAITMPATSAPVTLAVPARIGMSISPHVLPWSATITIRGHLEGGYVPPDGVALRLLVRYPGSRQGTPILALRTNARGTFRIKWSFNSGRGVASLPFWIATTATESDYPFAASAGPRIRVTFGRPTPVVVVVVVHHHHHRRKAARRHRRHARTHHRHRRHRAKHHRKR